jgi:hypothetical protein
MLRPEITSMTMEQFLLDEILFFSKNYKERRCYSHKKGICQYESQGGATEGCAIGRHLSTECQRAWDNSSKHIWSIWQDKDLLSLAPEWMQKMDNEFLYDCQALHDDGIYWDNSGLTNNGKDQVNKIVNKFKLN